MASSLPLWAVFGALLLGMVLVGVAGAHPLRAYGELLRGAVADVFGLSTTLVKATPLLFAGLGVGIALRAGLFNIGAEGQIYLGGLAAALVGLYLQGLPSLLHVLLALAAGFLAGAAWGLVPGLLKVFRGVNEVITTLLMNYVGILLISLIVSGPLIEPGAPYPYTRPLADSALLPVIIPGTDAHAGIVLALVTALLLHALLARTTLGFYLRSVGLNPSASAAAGINVRAVLLVAMAGAGGLAGVAGAVEVIGLKHRLFENFSPGYGYDAVVVAFLSNGQPLGVVAMGVFFGALRSGANIMQRSVGVPVAIVFAIQGLAVLFLAASLAVQRRWTLPTLVAAPRSEAPRLAASIGAKHESS
ncbi:MAG: ABC transporter permease [Armatimonadota bacterium]|nr:ABC transporter permease [Armatimonadota bacterium]